MRMRLWLTVAIAGGCSGTKGSGESIQLVPLALVEHDDRSASAPSRAVRADTTKVPDPTGWLAAVSQFGERRGGGEVNSIICAQAGHSLASDCVAGSNRSTRLCKRREQAGKGRKGKSSRVGEVNSERSGHRSAYHRQEQTMSRERRRQWENESTGGKKGRMKCPFSLSVVKIGVGRTTLS